MPENNEKRYLQPGWNALVDVASKKSLIIGERKSPTSYVVSSLEIINRPTEQELLLALDGYEKISIRKRPVSAS